MPTKKSKNALEDVQVVTFDVGGTLIQCQPSVGHIYAQAAARHGHQPLSPALLNRRFKSAWKAFTQFRHTSADWSRLVDATFQGLLEPPPSQTFFPELYRTFAEPAAWRIFDDVIPVLHALTSRRIRLGVISNWDERLRPLLRSLKLDAYFEAVVISCEAGAHKPDRRIYDAACAALKCEPSSALHVGDSFEMDVSGARAAGWQAVWLRRGKRSGTGEWIGSLDALVLDKL